MRPVPSQKTEFPRAILHFDGDSFFASIEQAMDYTLRGRPIITGAERGAATAISIEAKRLGVKRGMTLREIKSICPEVVIVSSNYTAYSIYAHRMYRIVRRYTEHVEEYSIDECFADITGLDAYYGMSYEEIAAMMKRDLETSLGITFGVGLAPNKVLAKVASKHNKPAGLTVIPKSGVKEFLKDLYVGNLWGVGPAMTIAFGKLGVETALQFAEKDEYWLQDNRIAKPYREMWLELQGGYIKALGEGDHHDDMKSIIKSRTFSPPSKDRAFIFSQLSKNIECACDKARRHGVRTREISFYLKTQAFTYHGQECLLPFPTTNPADILLEVEKYFDRYWKPRIEYRATGISLRGIVAERDISPDLFGTAEQYKGTANLLSAIDRINYKYGGATVFLASSQKAMQYREKLKHETKKKKETNAITRSLFERHKTINLPFLGKAV
jgi:nucleotidyltransferase/DNA polymerase involved in DNA repair